VGKPQILVVGYGEDHCPPAAYQLAYRVGRAVARRGAILVTGGLRGVMEAASRGAKEEGGVVVGIIPQEDKVYANPYCDIVIPTGIGYTRDFITAYSADAVIIVGGGAGTAIEAFVAYFKAKPIVALVGSGGIADRIAGSYIDDRHLVKVIGEEDPEKAVEVALDLLKTTPS
jgi:uncharacterized protein (TIGR00725 family)